MSSKVESVLVVEDEAFILDTVRDYLLTEGLEVKTARNGLEALEVLQSSGLPDLILLDMKMPLMDGWEFDPEIHREGCG